MVMTLVSFSQKVAAMSPSLKIVSDGQSMTHCAENQSVQDTQHAKKCMNGNACLYQCAVSSAFLPSLQTKPFVLINVTTVSYPLFTRTHTYHHTDTLYHPPIIS